MNSSDLLHPGSVSAVNGFSQSFGVVRREGNSSAKPPQAAQTETSRLIERAIRREQTQNTRSRGTGVHKRDGKLITAGDVERARREGASGLEIHDTVLIAAAFCMYNCYVDGLESWRRAMMACTLRWASTWPTMVF